MRKTHFITPLLLCIFAGGGFLFGRGTTTTENEENEHKSTRQSGYSFINPLLECENNDSFARQKYIPFEKVTLERIKREVQDTHSGVTLALYFRNLNNGPWFGVREDERFFPASLMKVTLLMGYMKWSEENTQVLDTKLKVLTEPGLNQLIPPEKKIEIKKEYTVRELLHYLIAYSDNTAGKILLENIPSEIQKKTFIDLGIPVPGEDPNYSLSVKEYASFFRILYNASYLSKKTSEEGLSILAQSAFKDGIVAPLPPGINVAHKFGEREIQSNDGTIVNQLHDCGIVYDPAYPYLLCVMTRGESSISDLSKIVSQTSEIIFEEVNKRFPIQA